MLKQLLFAGALIVSCAMATAASTGHTANNGTTASVVGNADKRQVKKWVKGGQWRNGFKGNPDKNVNLEEFYSQYHKNQAQWDAAFKWLASTDLLNAKAGKTTIPGTSIVASVQDGKNLPLKGHWTESHRRKIDFMYVVKGIEGFGLLDHTTSKPNCDYNEKKDVIHYDFDETKLNRFAVHAGNFIICFPSDWHMPLLETKYKDQSFRVMVLKIDYKE